MEAAISERLAGKRMLLLLDNFEHVLGAAPVLGAVLSGSEASSFLVTSRVALQLSWEHQQPLPPLATPPVDGQLNEVLRSPAAALFIERARAAKRIRATTPAGSDFTADLNPAYRWVKTSGIISRDKWGNLPGGEVFTSPGDVNGTFVIDGVVGDWLCDRYGNLKDTPLTVRVANNRLVSAESPNQDLRDDFWAYTHTDENSDRVGEFAIGTNIELRAIIGHTPRT